MRTILRFKIARPISNQMRGTETFAEYRNVDVCRRFAALVLSADESCHSLLSVPADPETKDWQSICLVHSQRLHIDGCRRLSTPFAPSKEAPGMGKVA